jgi:uncharacterized protein (TIGR02466 family)|tara:strand:- start:353 stop:934 length:582 start_codon:yes stop_codon:yes gene_type:complete
MVDVVQHKLFPTIVSEFEYNMSSDEHGVVLKELRSSERKVILQTKDDLHKKLPSFKRKVFEVTEKICRESKYRYDTLEVTGMWANMLKKGDSHPPHTHSNNVFSGVYYLEDGAPIQFFDPRPQASVLHPNLEYTTFDNSSMIQFNSQKGMGLIFPSWLQHWVPPTEKDRISISWNIILRGDYGQPHTLQNSHI